MLINIVEYFNTYLAKTFGHSHTLFTVHAGDSASTAMTTESCVLFPPQFYYVLLAEYNVATGV